MYYGVFKDAWKVIVLVKEKRFCLRWEKEMCAVIYDSDERYAKRLMGIINDSKDIPYKARIFTRKEEIISI